MCYAILYYIILYYVIWYYITLHYITLHYIIMFLCYIMVYLVGYLGILHHGQPPGHSYAGYTIISIPHSHFK